MESFKSHILVIDDDEGIRSLLKQFLNENGYLVNTASNALEAKEKISIIKFDLLVLDIMMLVKVAWNLFLKIKII